MTVSPMKSPSKQITKAQRALPQGPSAEISHLNMTVERYHSTGENNSLTKIS